MALDPDFGTLYPVWGWVAPHFYSQGHTTAAFARAAPLGPAGNDASKGGGRAMQSRAGWYVLATIASLATLTGVRFVTKHRNQPQPVDPQMAQAGEVLFNHKWTANDPLANGG